VDATIRRALEKVPADRFRRAADFADALGDPAFRHGVSTEAGVGSTALVPKRLVQGLAAATVMLALLSTWLLLGSTRTSLPVAVERFPIDEPASQGGSTGVSTGGPLWSSWDRGMKSRGSSG
jgi:hypothetical protein